MCTRGFHLSGQIALITLRQFGVLRNRRGCLNSLHTEMSSYHGAFLPLYDKKRRRIKWTECCFFFGAVCCALFYRWIKKSHTRGPDGTFGSAKRSTRYYKTKLGGV